MSVPTPTGVLQGVAAFNWDGAVWQPAGRAGPSVATPTGNLQGVAAFSGGPSWAPSGRAGPGVATPTGVLDGVAVYTWSGSQWTPPGGTETVPTPTGGLRGVAAFDWDGTAWQPAAQARSSVPTPYGVLDGVARFGWTGSAWAAVGAPSLSLDFMTSGVLDPRITFTRASTATYTDATGTIQTAAVNAPRWDYDPVTHALRGLLIEEARTNICLASAMNAAPWNVSANVVAAPSSTVNNAVAPDGTLSANRLIYPAVTGAGATSVYFQAITATAAAYTWSVWLRGNIGGEQIYLCVNPTRYSSPRLTLTTQWQRYVFTTPALTAAGWAFEIGTDLNDGTQISTPAQTIYAWGAQVELGAFATSLIPTTGAAASRATEVMTMPLAGWYSGTAGTIAAEAMLPANGNNGFRGIFGLDGGVGNIWHRAFTFTGQATVVAFIDSTQVTYGTMTPGTPFKIASTYAASGTRTAFNGVNGTATAVVSTPATYTTLRLGMTDPGNANLANGYLRRVQYWPRALSDTELQAVTS